MAVELRKRVTKPGTCGADSRCQDEHKVVPVMIWDNFVQYKGTHHGDSWIYEPFMTRQV